MSSVFAITYLQTPQLWRPSTLSCQAHACLGRRLKVIFRLFMVQLLLSTVRLLRVLCIFQFKTYGIARYLMGLNPYRQIRK